MTNVIADHLGYRPDQVPPGRCVGKSTALALCAIAHALQNPGLDIQIEDHVPQTKADEHTANMIGRYIQTLGFVGFKIIKTPNRKFFVRFDLTK